MDTFEKIKAKAAKYPGLSCEVDGDTLTIDPVSPDGFAVWITVKRSGFMVGFDGWHEDFDNEKEELDCFAFGLSDHCRLKVTKCGGQPIRWTLEHLEKSQWLRDSETGKILVPFWQRRTVEYLQNAIMRNGEQEAEDDAS